jgi:hypothetical protein
LAGRDVLGPTAGRIAAGDEPVGPLALDRWSGIVVIQVAVGGHVPRLPDCSRVQGGRLGQRSESDARAMLVDETADLGGEIAAHGPPARVGRAIADGGSGQTAPARATDREDKRGGQEKHEEGP